MLEAFLGYRNPGKRLIILAAILLLVSVQCGNVFALDKSRYITVDEVTTDMEAYCLTVLEGEKIEKFRLKILSIVRNFEPKRDAILVVGTDQRFIHAGAIHGCSGSPVYIDGRMAGALAAGWDGSKDPLYLVTPIADMLTIGTADTSRELTDKPQSVGIDFSKPIDLAQISNQFIAGTGLSNMEAKNSQLPLSTSLPQSVCDELSPWLNGMGIVPLAGGNATANEGDQKQAEYKPGGVLAVPLVWGDITMASIGTITEVIDNKIYGFGHSFTGHGPIDLPMSSGTVHTVIAGIMRASKFATPGPVKGAIRFDEATGVYGLIDAQAKMIPLAIKVNRYNDPQVQTYDCYLAVNRMRTPLMLQSAIIAAVTMRGSLPPEHTLKYKGRVEVEGYDPITFSNISSGASYSDIAIESLSLTSLLMSNPYRKVNIKDFAFEIDITPRNTRATIRTVNLSNTTVKPGQTVTASVLLQSYLSELSAYEIAIEVPKDIAPGEYEITVAGGLDYEKFLRKVAPHRFTAYDVDTLVETLGLLVSIKRDRLYMTMSLPAGGVVIKRAELPNLPGTKALLLNDSKRTIQTQTYQHWIEEDIYTGKVVLGSRRMKIKVEK